MALNKGNFMETYEIVSETPIVMDSLNGFAKTCHEANMKWWTSMVTGQLLIRNKGELLMLAVTELAEAMEGVRKDCMDDHLPNRKMEEVELADALIRIFDYAAAYNLDLSGAFAEKMIYNAGRVDHTHAARLAPGGKKI